VAKQQKLRQKLLRHISHEELAAQIRAVKEDALTDDDFADLAGFAQKYSI